MTITDHDLAQLTAPAADAAPKTIEKVSIVVSKGSLEGVYPGLIMANGARMEGIETNVFFTFFGLDAITRKRQAHIKVATVGNPGMHLPTVVGAIPGMSWVATKMMARKMEKLDIPPVPEFVEMIADSGAGIYGCQATVDMFGLRDEDFVPQVTGVLTVGEFYELAAGGEIVFTEREHDTPGRTSWPGAPAQAAAAVSFASSSSKNFPIAAAG
jgi:peroxiredoxin family protein